MCDSVGVFTVAQHCGSVLTDTRLLDSICCQCKTFTYCVVMSFVQNKTLKIEVT